VEHRPEGQPGEAHAEVGEEATAMDHRHTSENQDLTQSRKVAKIARTKSSESFSFTAWRLCGFA
jgi:hypothetical protein